MDNLSTNEIELSYDEIFLFHYGAISHGFRVGKKPSAESI